MITRLHRRYFYSATLAATLLSSASTMTMAQYFQPANQQFVEIVGQQEFTGQMIVRPVQPAQWMQKGLSLAEASAQHDAAVAALDGYNLIEYVPQLDHFIITVALDATENTTAITLMATGLFQYAEPNWYLYPLECPNDPRLTQQWHHNDDRMNSCVGWDIHTGENDVTVGICDTGILVTHEEFQLHRKQGYNAVDRQWENDGGDISNINPHGTMVTACAAANSNNGLGVAGVGWNLSHRMMRVSNDPGGGASLGNLQHAAITSIEQGDKVANVSYSGVDSASNLTTATRIKSMGGLLIWSAGNDGRTLTFGNRDADDLLVIGATNSGDNLTSFSAKGPFVDFTAPGEDIMTAYDSADNAYTSTAGTSFSAPLTAGLAALIWSYDDTLTPDEVEAILKNGCDDLGSGGIDDTYGYGRINVYNSLLLVRPALEFVFPQGLPDLIDPNGNTSVTMELDGVDPEPLLDTAQLHYNYGGDWLSVPITLSDQEPYSGTISFPEVACGSNVHYYFSIEGTDESTVTNPAGAPEAFHSAIAALGGNIFFSDDFQDDQGWTIENIDLMDGQWERGRPHGASNRGDPGEDFDGSGRCYITGNLEGNNDVDGGPTRLISPVFDLGEAGGIIKYARWFFNDDRDADRMEVEISADGGDTWVLVESVSHQGSEWIESSFIVSDFVESTGFVQVRFSVSDNPNDSVTEAGVDAFKIITPICDLINLEVEELFVSQSAGLQASNANPNQRVYFAFSISGEGQFPVPPLNITLDIRNPRLAGSAQADEAGVAAIRIGIPRGTRDRVVWFQAAQFEKKSNVVRRRIQ